MLLFLCVLAATAPDVREWGRSAQKQYQAGDAEALWPRLSAPMQQLLAAVSTV